MQLPALSGSGTVYGDANGSVGVSSPSLAGNGLVGVLASGAIALVIALAGTGTVTQPVEGQGSIAVAVPALASEGSVLQAVDADGGVAIAPSLSGTGIVGIVGSGDVTFSVVVAGAGDIWGEEAETGKYQQEHASALADIRNATGFSDEHASALRDLADAGP